MSKSKSKSVESPQKLSARTRRLSKGAEGRVAIPGRVGGGRAIGQRNKMTLRAKESLEEAFDRMGGVAGLVRWGQSNPTGFYQLWGRLIPKDVTVGADAGLEDLLGRLAEQRSTPSDGAQVVDGDYIVVTTEPAE